MKCDIDVIHYARKFLLFDDSHTLSKKQGGLFDVTVGASNGREVCELVDPTYMLNLLSKRCNKNDFGVYCYNGSAVLKIKVDHNQNRYRNAFKKYLRHIGSIQLYSVTWKLLITKVSPLI